MKHEFFKAKREQLVQQMVDRGAVKSESVRRAFLNVKRELFVRESDKENAYYDGALAIGFNQTISQPSTIAVMLEMLGAKEGGKVLEVGAGCGYVISLLSEIVGSKGKVFGIELVKELKEVAEKNIEKQGAGNVKIFKGDGTLGLAPEQPFDYILVSAACPYLPKPLFEQLKEEGAAVAPIGDSYSQVMTRIRKIKGQMLKDEYLQNYFVFVPLRGEFGWKE